MQKMLDTSAKGAQPRGEEAQRILSFFVGSIKNPTLVSGCACGGGGCEAGWDDGVGGVGGREGRAMVSPVPPHPLPGTGGPGMCAA